MDGATHVSTPALVAYEPAAGWRALARRTHTDSRGQARVLLRLIDDMLAETGAGLGGYRRGGHRHRPGDVHRRADRGGDGARAWRWLSRSRCWA